MRSTTLLVLLQRHQQLAPRGASDSISFGVFSDWRCSHTGNSFRHGTCELSQGTQIKKTSRVRAGLFEGRLFTGQKEGDELGKAAGTPGTADACARPIICILPSPSWGVLP